MRHHQPRQPKKTAGFSWGRSIAADGSTIWRLFRRDQRGSLHWRQLIPNQEWSLSKTATELNRARHLLRDQVDEIDLKLMGVI
jgi:hypothetical protein